ncbi:hypothetical protein BDZ90DRAFT_35080 [Jaminaea rosea]|uniref:Secreted protein n=1 Tax=Jaminaea rosea TaxID=1569628 RepID=A0A316V6M9_9BASI|nr:hypothetical protein BDZ90DRAFT_35080 [Jaminaea rosea]PWN31105.1 hypothetical protein BDZ90DRAFT_35080 [Jaminaea rosea]
MHFALTVTLLTLLLASLLCTAEAGVKLTRQPDGTSTVRWIEGDTATKGPTKGPDPRSVAADLALYRRCIKRSGYTCILCVQHDAPQGRDTLDC